MNDEFVKKLNASGTNELVKKTNYNAKINAIKDDIPSIDSLATTAALNAV